MILTPEEQLEYREEMDYLIETRGYEYIWGKETVMDKTKGLLRDAPGKIIDGLNKIATNPTVISINEKLAAHNAKLNAESQGKSHSDGAPILGGIGSGSGFGGMMQTPMRQSQPRQQPRQSRSQPQSKRRKHRKEPEHCDDYQGNDIYFNNHPRDDNPLGSNPLGEHPFSKKDKNQGGLRFGGDHL